MWWYETQVTTALQWVWVRAPFSGFLPAYGHGARSHDAKLNPKQITAYEINLLNSTPTRGQLALKTVQAYRQN